MTSPELMWEAASGQPYLPLVRKNSQFIFGSTFLLLAFILTGYFSLNRSAANILLVGVPASLAFGFGAVYMMCAVGVYV